jgi:hypothetical protein
MHIAHRLGGLGLSSLLLWGTFIAFIEPFAAADTAVETDSAPALTIYNQRFAVVRQKLPLNLKAGLNHVQIRHHCSP